MVFLELMRGNARQRDQAKLVADALPCLRTSEDYWKQAVGLAVQASEAGKPVPNTALLIFACAKVHRATIIHRDRHFEALEQLAG